jgi:hypothetical protein
MRYEDDATIYVNGQRKDFTIYHIENDGVRIASYIEFTDQSLWDSNPTVTADYGFRAWHLTEETSPVNTYLEADIGLVGPLYVFSTQNVDLFSFNDESFKYGADDEGLEFWQRPLVDITTGVATEKYRQYAKKLLTFSPIFALNAVWGKSRWMEPTQVLPQVAQLPYVWE